MVIRFGCSDCGCRLRVEDSLAGQRVRCRECEQPILAPAYGETPEGAVEGSGGKAEVLGSLLTPRVSHSNKSKTRKVAMGLGILVVISAFLYLGWQYVQTPPLPAVVQDLPEGDFLIYRNRKGASFFHEDKVLFPGTQEVATLYRRAKGFESVSIYDGNFDVSKVEKKLREKGYTKAERFLARDGESAWVTETRIVQGDSGLVEKVFLVKQHKAKRFFQGLSPRQKATWSRVVPGDFIYFGKNPSPEERGIVGEHTRSFLESIGAGDTGVGASIMVRPEKRARCFVVIGVRGEADVSHVSQMLKRLESHLESLKVTDNPDVCMATGILTQERMEIRANERAAMRALRALAEAQSQFQTGDRDGDGIRNFWTRDIAGLLGPGLIGEKLAAADLRPVKPGVEKIPYQGYWFVLFEGAPLRYVIAAIPSLPGTTGERTFIITQDLRIWGKDTEGSLPKKWPEKGWEKNTLK